MLTVAEASTGTIDNTLLRVSDVDNTATELTYTVGTVPANGTLQLSGVDLVSSDTFTQDDIDNNRLTYIHNGSETTSDTFTFTVADTDGGSIASQTFNITVTAVNDAPVLNVNSLTISEGQTVVLSSGDLSTSDVDNNAAQLTYTVNSVAGGQFELVADPGNAVTSFTQQQINDGDIQFVHDGNEAAPTYTLTVSDGALSDGPSAASITFTNVNDNPVITTASFTRDEGASLVVGNVTTTDVDGGAPQFTIVGGIDQAEFDIDLNTGELTFKAAPDFEFPTDDDNNNVYQLRIRVDDQAGGFAERDITVTINDTNDNLPVITPGQSFNIAENSINTTSAGTVLATDADTVGSLQNWQIVSGNNDNVLCDQCRHWRDHDQRQYIP